MKRWLRALLAALVPLVPIGSTVAGTIALEGSDATGYHASQPTAGTYSGQLFSFLKSDSYNASLPVLVYGTLPMLGVPGDTVYVNYNLSAYTTLIGAFSAVYIQSPGGCCSETQVTDASEIAKINALIAAGGSLAIMDYQGGNLPILSAAISGFAPTNSDFAGHMYGGSFAGLGGAGCFDSEVFLPSAIAKGFSQPGALGCWGHQAYNLDYFSTKGFISLVDSGTPFDGIGTGNWSSFLALGGALGTVPEPGSLALLGLGIFGLAAIRRRRRT